jgi:FkbM family methyltransferase
MEKVFVPYKPKWSDLRRYSTFIKYLKEYIKFGDLKSVKASLQYVLSNKLPKKEYISHSRMGKFWIRKGTNDFQYINYTYEKQVKKYILSHLDSFDVFIDVGACIGEYCIWLSQHGKRCIAFEPVNYKAVQKNIQLNGKENMIKLFPVGLGSKKEKVYFNILEDATGSSFRDKTQTQKEPNVQLESLDNLIDQLGINPKDRVLVKIDAEGMEAEVLEGAKNFILQHKHLTFIYEKYNTADNRDEIVLKSISNFNLGNIDESNKLAVKLS